MMNYHWTSPGPIDFSTLIDTSTRGFSGRQWVFQSINAWLAEHDGRRYFILTGAPGTGKTAVAGQLVRFSQGAVAPPRGLNRLAPGMLSAFHFCSAAQRSCAIEPGAFVQSLYLQLMRSLSGFAGAALKAEIGPEADTPGHAVRDRQKHH